jgi:hypothetical protein
MHYAYTPYPVLRMERLDDAHGIRGMAEMEEVAGGEGRAIDYK